jgi:hypothetical protein
MPARELSFRNEVASELWSFLWELCVRWEASRSICAVGRQHQDWSADYKVFSRSPWDADQMFTPVAKEYLLRYPGRRTRVSCL